jgi:hypothetical protein
MVKPRFTRTFPRYTLQRKDEATSYIYDTHISNQTEVVAGIRKQLFALHSSATSDNTEEQSTSATSKVRSKRIGVYAGELDLVGL